MGYIVLLPSTSISILVSSAAVLLGGCSLAPVVQVNGVDRSIAVDAGQQYHINLTLVNNGESPIELDMFSYSLTVSGRSYTGNWAASKTVPPFGRIDESIPAVILGDAAATGAPWSFSGDLTYLARNTLAHTFFDMGVQHPTVSLSGSGSVPEATPPAP